LRSVQTPSPGGPRWEHKLRKVGARKLSQVQDNLASFDLVLSADQLKTLDEASRIELGFPHDFYAKEMVRTLVYGGLRDQILA
jgi:hypothetical protein